jgi:uncharacterized protein HemY
MWFKKEYMSKEQRLKFAPLARYNDEVYHGVLHDEKYKQNMATLQKEWDNAYPITETKGE